MRYRPGDRVEYIAEPVFDLIIVPGEMGTVTYEDDGWVFAVGRAPASTASRSRTSGQPAPSEA